MAARKKGNPFRGVVDFMGEMSRMSDQMAGVDTSTEMQRRGYVDAWNPVTDVLASGPDLLVRSELPGVLAEDVEVTFSSGTLTIVGERKEAQYDDEPVYYVRERFWGRFRRAIALPEGVDENDISAQFEDGLLEVTVKDGAEAAGPKAIQVEKKRKKRQ